jgi:hypothetical protein
MPLVILHHLLNVFVQLANKRGFTKKKKKKKKYIFLLHLLMANSTSYEPPVAFSFLGLNILHSTPFSNALSLCYSLNARDQVSHPYRTMDKITVLYILIFTFLESRQD